MTTRSIQPSDNFSKWLKSLQSRVPQASQPIETQQSDAGSPTSPTAQHKQALRQLQQTYSLERRNFF